MKKEEDFLKILDRICQKDDRYAQDAYLFVFTALTHTMGQLKRKGHITGQELLYGIRQIAIKEYGRMARTVFEHWGVKNSEDFGNIVFNLVEEELLGKTDADSINDFKNSYDFKTVFEDDYDFLSG
ncbi:MAG: hypothetical protein GY853_05130 [PVC group bacterium]|nr:hypothetical protein [PVC group bacterium]